MAAIETMAKRKPNWTDEECLLLVTLTNENKHALRSRLGRIDISDEAGHLGKNFQAMGETPMSSPWYASLMTLLECHVLLTPQRS